MLLHLLQRRLYHRNHQILIILLIALHLSKAIARLENFPAIQVPMVPSSIVDLSPDFALKGITQSSRSWIILDTESETLETVICPDSSAENTYAIADILSNGFKMRYAGGLANQTGEEYLWAAFAEHPFKNSVLDSI